MAPLAVNTAAIPADRVGDPVQIVGFGYSTHAEEGWGTKRVAWSTLRDFDANLLHTGTYDVGPCQGDSGSPAIMSDSKSGADKAYGILSYTTEIPGGELCAAGLVGTRNRCVRRAAPASRFALGSGRRAPGLVCTIRRRSAAIDRGDAGVQFRFRLEAEVNERRNLVARN